MRSGANASWSGGRLTGDHRATITECLVVGEGGARIRVAAIAGWNRIEKKVLFGGVGIKSGGGDRPIG